MNDKEIIKELFSNHYLLQKRHARLGFLFFWLQDINWHTESALIKETENFTLGFKDTEHFEEFDLKIAPIVSTLSAILGWGLATNSWKYTTGVGLVKELFDLVDSLEKETKR